VNPYTLTFENVIISENMLAHHLPLEIINPHDRAIDWQLATAHDPQGQLFRFDSNQGTLAAHEKQQVRVYFSPTQ
jgi:hypothetical protein